MDFGTGKENILVEKQKNMYGKRERGKKDTEQ